MKEFQNYSDNELDDLFRDAHSATELSSDFQPSFWMEMEALLPEQKQKRRAGIFWWTAAALLVLGVTLFVVNDAEKSTIQPKTIAGNNDNSKLINKSKNKSKNAQLSSVTHKDTQPTTKSTNESNDRLVQQQLLKESVVAQVDKHLMVELTEDNNQSTIESSTNVVDAPSKLATISPKTNVQQLLPLQKYSDEQLFYVQVGTGIGRSYQSQVTGKNNAVYQFSIGAGINKQISGMHLAAGIQLRTELLSNIQWVEPVSATSYQLGQAQQIYSVDFPLSIGAVLHNNNVFSFNMTPGIQSFYVGSSSLVSNNVIVSREQKVETLQHTKSLTMEMGISYCYSLRKMLLMGAQVNMDIIRPFNLNFYAGKQTPYPVNGQIFIRKLF